MFQLNEKLTQGSVLIGSKYIQSWYTECPDMKKIRGNMRRVKRIYQEKISLYMVR